MKPMKGRVLVKPDYSQTDTGIALPENFLRKSHRRFRGEVKAVADDLSDMLKVGDHVIFDDYGTKVTHEGEECTLVSDDYIHLVVLK